MAGELIPGQISWSDLTVADAESVRSFYESVVGWRSSPVEMGQYSDYSMIDSDGNVVAGVCHARGENARLPPVWLMYVTVDDLDLSVARCRESGGDVIDGPRSAGRARIAVIQDPAGAVLALYEPSKVDEAEEKSQADTVSDDSCEG